MPGSTIRCLTSRDAQPPRLLRGRRIGPRPGRGWHWAFKAEERQRHPRASSSRRWVPGERIRLLVSGGVVILGVKKGPAPSGCRSRLRAVRAWADLGLVDITNFYSIDQSRPLHVLRHCQVERRITVRRGRGRPLPSAHGKEYEPTSDDCVSPTQRRDRARGASAREHTIVDEGTTDVLLDARGFEPRGDRRHGRRHGSTPTPGHGSSAASIR